MSESPTPTPHGTRLREEGGLFPSETFWRDHQPWLKEQGYTLRARYQPDWIPSWKKHPQKPRYLCEDGINSGTYNIMDAVRGDGTLVALKQVQPSKQPHEAEIGRLFSSEPLGHDPSNYCVPILDVLHPPDDNDLVFLVMPLLYDYDIAPLETIGEGVEFIRQMFETLDLMHQNNVAHRDCKYTNIMVDALPLFNAPPHPLRPLQRRDYKGYVKQRFSRTRKPVKHYLVDFGLSKVYKPEDAPHLEIGGWGGDHTVPEFLKEGGALCDPFPVDVYCMGNLIRTRLLEGDDQIPGKLGFEFMRELIDDMVQDDPKQRPTMKEVVSRFNDIVKGLSSWKLRSRVVVVTEKRSHRIRHSIVHWVKRAAFVVRRIPAVPRA